MTRVEIEAVLKQAEDLSEIVLEDIPPEMVRVYAGMNLLMRAVAECRASLLGQKPPCGNPECDKYPYYGVAPHRHSIDADVLKTKSDPKDTWPDNFHEDPEVPGCGVYSCPDCQDAEGMFYVAPQKIED